LPAERFCLDAFLPYRLNQLAERVSGALATVYSERFDLSIPQWRILATLQGEPGLTARHVATRTNLDKVCVSRALARLVDRGLVARSACSHDARASELRLTREGRQLFARIAPLALGWEETLLCEFSPTERRDLLDLLEKLTQGLQLVSAAGSANAAASSARSAPRTES
jgi:DNA-binding MarR family transcriptional regulator